MAPLDRFRRKPSQPPTAPRGASGRAHYAGYLQLEELNAELQGIRGLQKFDEMVRTDADMRHVVLLVCNPVTSQPWSVEPFGGDDAEDRDHKCAAALKWALFDHMRPGLTGHLAEALPLLVRSGFAPFEQMWETAEHEGRTLLVPRKLGLRLPRTIQRWHQDEYGDLVSIDQYVPGWTATGPGGSYSPWVNLPAEDLVYYRVGAEGDNWEGTSMIRSAFKHWYLKDKIERLDAIAQEREATGIPVLYPPQGTMDEAVLDDLEEAMQRLRSGDQGYVLMPGPKADTQKDSNGWLLEILGMGGEKGSRDPQPSLEYHSKKIAAALVAEFMMLGQQQVGARATADVQQDPFLAGVEALATVTEDELNATVVNRFCELNFDPDRPPRLSMSLVDSTSLTELKDYVQGLVTSGTLVNDPELEDFLRQKADLPPANADVRKKHEEAADAARKAAIDGVDPNKQKPGDGENGGGNPTDPPKPDDGKKMMLRRQERDLRDWEQLMSLDTAEGAIDSARERFERAGTLPTRAVAADAAAAVAAGKAPSRKPPQELVNAIADILDDIYTTGRQTVAEELDRQRPNTRAYSERVVLAAGDRRPSLLARARLAAQGILDRILQDVSRAFLGGTHELGPLQLVGEQAALGALRAEALLNAAPALNLGRADTAHDFGHEIIGARYTSILDGNCCRRCRAMDDDTLRPLNDKVLLANVHPLTGHPPNPNCEGGDRCRCMLFYQLADEDPAPGGLPDPPEGIVAQGYDPEGNVISITEKNWRGHLTKDPARAFSASDVLAAIASPDVRTKDPHESGTRVRYWKQGLGAKEWLRVIVDYLATGAQVVTAIAQKKGPEPDEERV